MKAGTLKADLIDKIEHADDSQLKEIYGLITNYFGENGSTEGWTSLSEYHKERITESIKEADAGLVMSAKKVIKKARENYGLNG